MIKLVIHCSDIHLRCFQRHEEYAEQLTQFIEKCKSLASQYKKEEVRIVIAGDLVHQKNTISNELFVFASTFIRQLEDIARVIIISGNHDLLVNNTSRKDTMTALFETANFQNSIFVDGYLGFDSGTLIDDNVTWAEYIQDSYADNYSDYDYEDIDAVEKVTVKMSFDFDNSLADYLTDSLSSSKQEQELTCVKVDGDWYVFD